MSIMDLKSKGMAWAGDIFQKFETMCHEGDNVVKKDTFKYVENQVHAVGENMKKIYSDVVHDLMPPSVDPTKCETPVVALKRNAATGASIIKSMIGIEDGDANASRVKQSPLDPSNTDLMTTKLGKGQWELQDSNKLNNTRNYGEPLELERSESALGIIIDGETETSDVSTEENAMKENSSGPEELESVTFEISDEFPDVSCENPCGVHSVHGEEIPCPQEVTAVYDSSAGDSNSAGGTVTSSEIAFLDVSSKKEVAEAELASSSSSLFKEYHCLPGNMINNTAAKLISCSNSCNVAGNDSDSSAMLLSSTPSHSDSSLELLSSTSAPIVSRQVKSAEIGLASSSSMLTLVSIGCLDDSAPNNVTESEMESFDLSDNVKLEESCVLVDNSFLYEVSRRNHRLRSYKKRIQDAFSSRKRLTKEYEQLAVWFGDLDCKDTMQHEFSSSTSITLHHDATQDSEWELL